MEKLGLRCEFVYHKIRTDDVKHLIQVKIP